MSENGTPKWAKNRLIEDSRAGARIFKFRMIPGSPVCARYRLGAAGSLVSDVYTVGDVGKFGRKGWGKFRKTERREGLKKRLSGDSTAGVVRLAPACFRGLPSAPASAYVRRFR